MTIEINLSPETEARLRAELAASGQDLQHFLLAAIEDKLEEEASEHPENLSPEEFRKRVKAFTDAHPVVAHFVDDSRESIYEGRGE